MQKKLNRIYDGHMQALLFWMCWLVYFASYIGRLNYSSAKMCIRDRCRILRFSIRLLMRQT